LRQRAAATSAGLLIAAIAAAPAAAEPTADRGELGKPARDFALRDVSTGTEHKLSQYAGKPVVLCFQGNLCAMVDRHQERFAGLIADFSGKGAVFLAINSNADESVEATRAYAARMKLSFPTLKDPGNAVADYFAAKFTPQFIVLDAKGVWRYSGAFDDNPFPDQVKAHYVRDALEAVLAGRTPPVEQTKAYGCKIARAKK
jgi:peroxiredoxin